MVECIILAGGQGTRLRAIVSDLPKPMADIAGRPFLWWLMTRLNRQDVGRVIFSLGYRSESIQNYFGTRFEGIQISYAIEKEPLGTGGAMKYALEQASESQVLVLNGDTYADVNLRALLRSLDSESTHLALAVAYQCNSARYGFVAIDERTGIITGFREKEGHGAGYINAGVYCVRRDIFKNSTPAKFSFEHDFLPRHLRVIRPLAVKGARGFIDIGVPEDYARAQSLIPKLVKKLPKKQSFSAKMEQNCPVARLDSAA
jgi:D-glycero-alpha-D-manno-heptose 1-phosphate guanylyltransferase